MRSHSDKPDHIGDFKKALVKRYRESEQKSFSQQFLQTLQGRAQQMREAGESEIAGGKPGERARGDLTTENMYVRQLPDDEQGILRISVGGVPGQSASNYCSYRGDPQQCAELLRHALRALRQV